MKVQQAAFGGPAEARLVERIVASPWAVPELELVAEDQGMVVGHVLFSHVELVALDGERWHVLALAPLAVQPERQNEGIGTTLTRAGLAEADKLGEPLVVVLGHAAYYPRFGFRRSDALGIHPPPEYPQSDFFALPLSSYRPEMVGQVAYPPTFAGL